MFGFNRDRYFRGSLSPSDFFNTRRYCSQYALAHPYALPRSGITVFCGVQGSGKTLSAVQYTQALASAFPRSVLCSNIEISGLPPDYDVRPYDGFRSLCDICNGEFGVLYLIDEIHLEFNSLESKSIPLELFTEISQQRKQRKHIIATSQLFLRLAKPFREQASRVVLCSQPFPGLQYNTILDGSTLSEVNGEVSGRIVDRSVWFHSPSLYQSYDTYAKVRRYSREASVSGLSGRSLPYAGLSGNGS